MKDFCQSLLILTSPPASGKTYWIESFGGAYQNDILVISPLRALVDECRGKWPHHLTVMTPEEWSKKKTHCEVVIFDEYHLHDYWGSTFRPLMWEVFYELSAKANLVILLTATFSEDVKESVKNFEGHFEEMLWFDAGNLKLKYEPRKYFKCPTKNFIEDYFYLTPKSEGVDLIFCPYRKDVAQTSKKLQDQGYSVLTCLGGEAKTFKEDLLGLPQPDFIVATTVLSHGVNLPEIKRVYFTYALENQDFWIQMVARGGRRGQSYEVFSLENPHGIKWNCWKNFLAIQWLRLKIGWYSIPRQIQECFLKA